MSKEPSSTLITAPDTVTWFVTFENAGPGEATNVRFTDELNPDFEWSLGSGSEVCEIVGTTLTCFAETVADGVFEVLEITAVVDTTDCGTYDNTGTATFEGGQEPGSVTATAPPVEVTGCEGTPGPTATTDAGTDAGGAGLPDTRALPAKSDAPIALLFALLVATSLALLRLRRRSALAPDRSSEGRARR